MELIKAIDRQRKIYIDGISGRKPEIPFHSEKLRKKAARCMSEAAWAYIDGSASDEQTTQRNLSAFTNVQIIPRMLRDNSTFDFSSELLGTKLAFPFLLAPIGALDMVTKNADLKVAKAAEQTGTPMIFSNQAGNTMEECSRALKTTPHWFQLYWSKSDVLVLSLLRRAEACGCKALVLTVDTTMLGWRPRDLALGSLPFLKGFGLAQYTSDQVFQDYVKNGWEGFNEQKVKPKINFETLKHLWGVKSRYKGSVREALKAIQLFTQIYTNPSLTWEKIAWLKTQTHLPIIIKGILHPEDALKAREVGVEGIIVSNHGGRQVDGVVATLEMLPKIRQLVPKPFKIFLDSGIRSGSDIFKAVALGADAVLVGRPFVYGLAMGGSKGVVAVLRNFQNDFELTARLSGCRCLDEINKEMCQTVYNIEK